MPGRRTLPEVRASLAIMPVREGGDLFGSMGAVFAGLATWLAVSRMPPTPTQSPDDLQRVGAASGARYVLHGWTEAVRARLRLTIELNEAQTGRVLWSDRLVRPVNERDGLQQDAAERVGQAVGQVVLERELERIALHDVEALTAQDLAIQAFDVIMRPRRAGLVMAADALAEAEAKGGVQGGTRFAQVWWHLMAISQGWGGDLARAGAVAATLDLKDPAAAALSAYVEGVLRQDHATASAVLDRVLDSAPLCGIAGSLKALILCWLGDAQGAMAHAEQAVKMPMLGPEVAWRDHVAGLAHYIAGRYEEAARWARASAMHHPGLAANVRVLAASLAVLGRLDEAQQAASQVLVIDPDFRIACWRERCSLPDPCRDSMAKRLRLAGLPG